MYQAKCDGAVAACPQGRQAWPLSVVATEHANSRQPEAVNWVRELTRQINARRDHIPRIRRKAGMMPLSGPRSQNFFATAIFVSAVMLCWSAEAAPKNPGYKIVINASQTPSRPDAQCLSG